MPSSFSLLVLLMVKLQALIVFISLSFKTGVYRDLALVVVKFLLTILRFH